MATILLVEDEASMRLLTCAKLKHQFTIICAKDGVEALELLERQPVDLIIADVMMPRMDGYTLVNALLRRAHIASERRIVIGPVVLDSSTYTVSRGEQVLELPKKEFELLYKLLSYPGQIFTRNQLLDDIWGFDSESGEDTVKTHISRLRNKLRSIEEFRIITIKGLGYKAEVLE